MAAKESLGGSRSYALCHLCRKEIRTKLYYCLDEGIRYAICTKCHYSKNRENAEARERYRTNRMKTKIEVLTHYSGGSSPKCADCGSEDIRALTIDHIKGGGGRERRQG